MTLTYFPDVDQLDVDFAPVRGAAETYDAGCPRVQARYEDGRLQSLSFERASRTAPWLVEKARRRLAARAKQMGRRIISAEISEAGDPAGEIVTEDGDPAQTFDDPAAREWGDLVQAARRALLASRCRAPAAKSRFVEARGYASAAPAKPWRFRPPPLSQLPTVLWRRTPKDLLTSPGEAVRFTPSACART
jgi:D-serine deaminase-like pyridoxal phosphate-dependent protein